MQKNLLAKILLISISIMFVISSTSLLHANEAEFIIDRFEGIDSFKFSLFDSFLYAAYLIGGPIAGLASAKVGRRKPFVIGGAVVAAAMTILMTVAGNYPLLLVLRFLQGFFCVASWQSLMTMVLDYSDDTNRGRNMGIFGSFMALSMGLGPVLGGVLASIHLFAPYYVSAAQCLLAVVITFLFISEPGMKLENIKPKLVDSFAFARHRPALMVPALFNLVDRLHMGFIIFIIPLMLREVLQLGPEYRGMLLGVNAIMYIILQYPMGRLSDRVGRYKLLLIGSIGYGSLLCLTGPVGAMGLIPLVVLFFVLGIFSGFAGPANSALVGDIVNKDENPLAMGFFTLFGNVGMVTGSLFGGMMLSVTNFTVAFIVAGAIELSTLAVNISLLRKYGITKMRAVKVEK